MPTDLQAARLTTIGLDRFRILLQRAKSGQWTREGVDRERRSILKAKDARTVISRAPKVDDTMTFADKRELADHAISVAESAGVAIDPNADEGGFWSWMALVHFWQITARKGDGFKALQVEKFVADAGPRRFYKHLVGGPAWVMHRYGKHAEMLLMSKPNEHGDKHEQLLGNAVTSRSPGVIEAANRLFGDPGSPSGMKPGSNPNNASDPGLRYFVRRLQQIACTHDIRSMSADDIVDLYPDIQAAFAS